MMVLHELSEVLMVWFLIKLMDRYIFSSVGGGIRRRGHPQMCLGAGGMKMVA